MRGYVAWSVTEEREEEDAAGVRVVTVELDVDCLSSEPQPSDGVV